MDELRLAIRRLRKRPAATLASILTLAGAIGAAVVMWTVLHALLINPLPVHDPSTLVTIVTTSRGELMSDTVVYNTYRDLHDHSPFAAVAGWGDTQALLRDRAGERPAPIQFVSTGYFQTLGVRPSIGREFAPHEDQPGAPLVALLSDRYWQQAFASDTSVVGSTIHVAGKPVTIVGVAPRGFRGLKLTTAPDLFMPLHVIEDIAPVINYLQQARTKQMSPTAWIAVVGRMPAGVPPQDVTARLAALPAWSPAAAPKPVLEPLDASALPRRDRAAVVRFTRMLAITVGLLLLTGCATVALLLLVRTEDRRIEFATCLALGASKARLIRGVATEGALMAIAGAALAVPAGLWLFGLLETFSLPGGVRLRDLVPDIRGQGVALAAVAALAAMLLTVAAVTLSGLSSHITPALRAAHSTERARPRARAVLIVCQLAIAVVLTAGTALFVRSLTAAVRVNPARDPSAIVTARFRLTLHGYTPERARAFHDEVAARVTGQATIAAAALIADGFSMSGGLVVDGVQRTFRGSAAFSTLHGPYFETLGLGVVEGRPFGPEDTANSPMVTVISESLARFIAGDGSAVGRRIRLPFGRTAPEVTIVGVAQDLITSVRQLQPFVVYLPAPQHARFAPGTLVARASGDGRAAIRDIMAVARAIDPAVSPLIATLKDDLYNQMRPQQLGATVLGTLGAIAAILTILGLYVIAESTAAQRTREFGIRAALGATRRELRALLLRDHLRLAAIGALLGLAIVYAGAGTVRAFLFGVEAFDPLTLTAVPSAIVVLAVLVGLGPAVRASRADIAQVLRRE